MEEKTITTSTGTILTFDKSATDYARYKKLYNVLVFRAKYTDKWEEYVIFEGQTPVFSSQQLEAIGVHLDIMALQKEF